MNAELLQQLRDVHAPVEPGLWPPAPGWWLLLVVALALLALVGRWLHRWRRRRAPLQRCRKLHEALLVQLHTGVLDKAAYLHACNDLLRRLAVHGYGLQAAKGTTGRAWLELLDSLFGGTEFTDGPGQILGYGRFAASVPGTEAFEAVMIKKLSNAPVELKA